MTVVAIGAFFSTRGGSSCGVIPNLKTSLGSLSRVSFRIYGLDK
jgi:hypothetical protein